MTIRIPFNDLKELNLFFDSHQVENTLSQGTQCDNSFVYFARYGNTFDGHTLALRVVRSQNYVVVEQSHVKKCFENSTEQSEILNSQYCIQVPNVEQTLIQMMHTVAMMAGLEFFSIGVTGTSGKTSIVQLTGQIFDLLNVHALKIGTLGIQIGSQTLPNSHQTTPDYPTFIQTLVDAKNLGMKHLVMEVSSHGLAQTRLNDWEFDIGIFTNFSQDHLDFHKTMEEYFAAKTKLFSRHLKKNGTCVISTQSEKWKELLSYCYGSERQLYLLVNDNIDGIIQHCAKIQDQFKCIRILRVLEQKSSIDGVAGRFCLMNLNGEILVNETFASHLIGEINFENLMSVFCICIAMGLSPSAFMPHFAQMNAVSGRMERVGRNVFVDYSHKPGALESVLSTLRKVLPNGSKLISVFGCGGNRDTSKRPIMGKIATELSDITIITSDNPRYEDPNKIIEDIVSGIEPGKIYFVEPDRYLAIEKAFHFADKSDIILIAGKGHEAYQQIGSQKIEFSDVKIAKEFLGKN